MKVVIVGPGEVDNRSGPVWDAVRAVMRGLTPQDELVHTGRGVGPMVESVARRAKGIERRRLPRLLPPQMPEIGRYERAQAFRQNAMQLLHAHAPHVLVYVGYGIDEETEPILAMAEQYPRVKVLAWEDFVRERVG